MHRLTIFYDGFCPLCIKEMRSLTAFDKQRVLKLVDIQEPGFSHQYPAIDAEEANRVLLALDENAQIIRGLDVSLTAWTLVGKGHRVFFLRWDWLRPALNVGYRFFARHRYTISALLTGRRRCESCSIRLSNAIDNNAIGKNK